MQDQHNMYAIMKTMCPPSYRHNAIWQCTWAHDVWFNIHHVPECMS